MNYTDIIADQRAEHYAIRESYKTIRANLLFCGTDIKVIVVTSCQAHEGKTTTTLALCQSLNEIDKKVLLIDADLRRSSMMQHTSPKNKGRMLGLSEYLSGQAKKDEVVYHTQYENLDLIYAGQFPPNPAELVGSVRFKELVDGCRAEYDYIIIDSSPIGLVIDAAMMAPYCDGAIMIVSVGEVSAKIARETKEQMEKSGCRIIGVVLNEAEQAKKAKKNRRLFGGKKKEA